MMKRGVVLAEDLPTWLHHRKLKGVYIGGCVVKKSPPRPAHAHFTPRGGWICLQHERWLKDKMLCLHELAHVVTNEGHTPRWARYLVRIGGTLKGWENVLKIDR